MSETILFETIGNVAKITLNRPDAYNSFTREMALAFQDALKICKEDDGIRAIYITGNGKAFSAGQDIKELLDPSKNVGLEKIVAEHYNPIVLAIYQMPKPVIAAVNGVAAGAGANIALVCDITLAKESASFIQAFSKIGLIPDSGGTHTLPRLVGFQRAKALAMLGSKVSAKEAENMGMIFKYFPDESFEEKSMAIATKLSQMPTKGLAYTKELYNKGINTDMKTQLALEGEFQIKASATADYEEGIQAFVEKRKPNFKGK